MIANLVYLNIDINNRFSGKHFCGKKTPKNVLLSSENQGGFIGVYRIFIRITLAGT